MTPVPLGKLLDVFLLGALVTLSTAWGFGMFGGSYEGVVCLDALPFNRRAILPMPSVLSGSQLQTG